MIVKGREIIPPLNYFPYSFLFPLFSYYSYSSFFFLPFRTRPPRLRSPSSFPHLIFVLSSSSLHLLFISSSSSLHPYSVLILAPVVIPLHLPISLCPSLHPAFPYSPISPHLLTFRSHPHPLTQLEGMDLSPMVSSHIRTAETITGRRQIACLRIHHCAEGLCLYL